MLYPRILYSVDNHTPESDDAFRATLAWNASVFAFQAIETIVTKFIPLNRYGNSQAAMNFGITLNPPFRHHRIQNTFIPTYYEKGCSPCA